MFETLINVIYAATILVLWICIAVNFKLILRNNNLSKEYLAAIELANEAELKFLDAVETYHTMCKKLQEDENNG